ncbi:MAG: pilus assembly protein CpaE [Anaerolineae bacterium]
MIALETARTLKEAGLRWLPRDGDRFAIPDRGLDDHVFVVSRMSATVQRLRGHLVIAFQGAYEWALDYIWLDEVVWLPHEAQLRAALEAHLVSSPGQPTLRLTGTPGGYVCEILFRGSYLTFEADDAGEVYAEALLYILRQ